MTFQSLHLLDICVFGFALKFLFSRSEVSSSSSSESLGQSGRQLSVQVLLHSQNLQDSAEQDQQDCEILSSQDDLFDADKTGTST